MRKFYLFIFAVIYVLTGFTQTQTISFNSSGISTWIAPCGVTSIQVECWGAGGAGGGATTTNRGGGGGAGGAYAMSTNIAVIPGVTYNISVGRGARGSDESGDDGGSSWFNTNSTVIAMGGEGGGRNNGAGGSGTITGSIGNVVVRRGGNGFAGSNSYSGPGGGGAGLTSGGGDATNTSAGVGGNGGDGNGGGRRNGNNDGYDGSTIGGGGGGAHSSNGFDTDGGDGANGQVVITYTGLPNYCSPSFGTNVEPITKVIFAGINNTTSPTIDGSPELESFCITGVVIQGSSTNPISLKGNTGGNYRAYFIVYIDWDQDGEFNQAGEKYSLGYITNSTGIDSDILTGNIAVPGTAVLGQTKMRVIKKYGTNSSNGDSGPCEGNSYGQAEDYLINVNGNCTQPTGATANSTPATLIVCSGTPVTLKQTGGTLGVGASWKWYKTSCGGTLLNTNSNADGAYTFTPTATATYYVRAEGGSCGTVGICKMVTVTVNNTGSISTAGSSDFSACKSINNTAHKIYTIGGGATGVVSSGLPAGLTGNFSGTQYTISGSPSATGTFNYSLTLTGNAPCTNPGITGTITVSEAPLTLTYSANTVVYCTGAAITSNTPTITGGTPTLYTVAQALPSGLSIDPNTGIITGVPNATAIATNYTVTASNSCGSKTRIVNITIANGNVAYPVTPGGAQNVCSSFGGIIMGLTGSQTGASYQLFLNGTSSGVAVAGTGSPISFGNKTAAGTYTVKTTSGCATNMNGSTIINITAAPNRTFTYPAYTYCAVGLSSAANFAGLAAAGTFSASPAGLVFSDNTTGVIDLAASVPNTYPISYTIPASGGCGLYTYTQPANFVIASSPQQFEVFGGGGYCSPGDGVEVGLANSQAGVNYQLFLGAVPVGAALAGTGDVLSFGDQTGAGTYTIKATTAASPNCQATMPGNAVITINPNPSPIKIMPVTSTVCQGTIVPLVASGNPVISATANVSVASGNINADIPDDDALGASSLLKVTGIPAGATITSVVINFNIPHDYAGDLVINLKGPNGNVLNIANSIGGNNDDFTNTTISSLSVNPITSNNSPFTGTFSPQGGIGVIGGLVVTANTSNVSGFPGLYGATATSANGNWILSARDRDAHFGSDEGTISNWSITINYSYTSNPVDVTWSAATDLFTNPGGTTAYVPNTNVATVYANPATSGTKVYTATATNSYGCTVNAQSTITFNPTPALTMAADYCTYSAQGKIRITANSNVAVNGWLWSGGMGTGTVSGNSNYIDPNSAGTYYVTAKSTSNGCVATGAMSIAQELVVNGDFEAGNTGFTSTYNYGNNTVADGLYPAGTYSVHNNPNFLHGNFWGTDHTTANGEGNFMMVNGTSGSTIWKQTVTVLPNTTYYFSAYAVSLNDVAPFANLQFRVNGVQVGSNTGVLASKPSNNNGGTWVRFYGNWASNVATTAVIEIIDLESAAGGNDFGLDDISFGTLSTFLNLTSAVGSNTQVICANTPITDISYEVGGDGSKPIVTNLPAGLTTYWNGRDLVIKGTPSASGALNYTVAGTGCNHKTATGTLNTLLPSDAGNFPGTVVSACYNTNGTISVTGSTGTIKKWQTSTDSLTWSDLTNATTSQTYTNLLAAKFYRAIAQNGTGCVPDTSLAVKVGVRNLWTGRTNTDWQVGSNWSDDQTPSFSLCSNVYIPNTTNKPVLSNGTGTVTNLNISSGALLTVTGTGILEIKGTITNSGSFDAGNGTLVFNGTSLQSIAGSMFVGKTIKNLTLTNAADLTISATAGDTLKISGIVAFGAVNNAIINTNNNLVLTSTATGTARVAEVKNGNGFNGFVTVERYFPARRAWRLFTGPVSMGASLFENWQNGGNYKKGRGTYVSGASPSGAAGNGIDQSPYNNSSLKQGATLSAVANTKTTRLSKNAGASADNIGYFIFVRGDRIASNTNPANMNTTTLSSKGKLQTGDQVFTATGNAGDFVLIGNPYASPVDFGKLTLNNLSRKFYAWDPYLQDDQGAYVTFIETTPGVYVGTPQRPGGLSQVLQSGQAIFVEKSSAAAASLTFKETAKSNTDANNFAFRPTGIMPSFRTNLFYFSVNGETVLADGILAQFDNGFNKGVDMQDALKFGNVKEMLALQRDNRNLSVEMRPLPGNDDTLFLRLTKTTQRAYRFEFDPAGLDPLLTAFLEDSYTNKKTVLSLAAKSMHDFVINSDPNSSVANRFRIVFKQITAPLPVTYTRVNAYQEAQDIAVNWTVENEININKYEVEKSLDGGNFTSVSSIGAIGANRSTTDYKWLDKNPVNGNNYYRIRSVSADDKYEYSKTVVVKIAKSNGGIRIYPNPVTDGIIGAEFKNMEAGIYRTRLLNAVGQTVLVKQVNHVAGTSMEYIRPDYKMVPGIYQLEVTAPDNSVVAIKVIVK